VADDYGVACNEPFGSGQRKGRVQGVLKDNQAVSAFGYSVRVRLGEAFEAVVGSPHEVTWLTLGEFWNNSPGEDGTFRITLSLVKEAGEEAPLRFALGADHQADDSDPTWHEAWPGGRVVGEPAPIGEWFTMRVAVVEGDAEAGRVSFEVTEHDGATHGIDMVGVTHGSAGPDGFAALHPIKLYTSGTLVCELRARGLVLDVLWDDFAIGGVAAP